MLERRRAVRTRIDAAVTATRHDGKVFGARCENVSIEGAAVLTEQRLFQGERIMLALSFLPEATASASCEVAYVIGVTHPENHYKIGLRFLELDAALREQLDAFIEKRLAGAVRPHPLQHPA